MDIKKDFPLSELSLVFGCGGDRDKDKRSMMGNIAQNYCNNIYLTDDNPRFEDPKLIRNQIKNGLNKKFHEIPSRLQAINTAINKLKSGDVLLVVGKGHENYQEYKDKSFFSDKLEILKSIKNRNRILSNSIKTNILNETLGNNPINKNNILSSASVNSKKINKTLFFWG